MRHAAKKTYVNTATRVMTVAAVLFGLIGTALVIWNTREDDPRPVKKPEPEMVITRKIHIPDPLDSTRPDSRTAADNTPSGSEKVVTKQITHADDPVMQFLLAYGLQKYQALFAEAILSDNFDDIGRKIRDETGQVLMQFDSMPVIVKNRYHILETVLVNPTRFRFFLFWKPSLSISDYQNGRKGKKIQQLQMMLQKIDLYDHDIDGIVDTRLTRALIRFQRLYSLEQTGRPDTPTLFLLTAVSDS